MFPMTVTINNQAQFNAVIALFQKADAEPVINAVPVISAESKITPKKEEVKKDGPALATLTTTEAPAILLANKQPPPEYGDAAQAIKNLAAIKGRDAAIDVLKKFGVDRLVLVRPEEYGDVIQAANAAME